MNYSFVCKPFDTADFPPRWSCGNWSDLHGWTHIIADSAIFTAYAAIPALIAYFLIKRRDVQLPSLWWLFGSFIFFCGLGHLIEASLFWYPWYRFSAIVKVITAVVSCATVLVLAKHLPALLSLPGLHQLNQKLRQEIEARAKSEEEKERFFNLSLDILCIADMSGRFTRVNPAFVEALGYTEEELTAKPYLEFVHPEDRDATVTETENLGSGIQTLKFENRYQHKNGEWRWLAWRATPCKETGLIYATARDITQQRIDEEKIRLLNAKLEKLVEQQNAEAVASEQYYRHMVEQVQDYAIYMLDLGGHVISWNHGAERNKGYTSEEIIGKHFSCFYTPEDVEAGKHEKLLQIARETGRAHDEGWRVRKDGTRLWAEVVITAIYDESGQLSGYAKVTHDLTERKRIQEQSMRSQRLESIGTLSGGIAHDLNNAIAPILLSAGLLRQKYPDSPGLIDLIENGVTRAGDMLRQLLSFAKGVEGERVAVSPQKLVGEVSNIIRSTFPKNIQLITRIEDNTPGLLGDSTQLHQVLLNLCVNARDAMPDGGNLTIEVKAAEVDSTFVGTLTTTDVKLGSYVCLRVIDSGTGIPPEIIDRIFEPFFTTKGPEKGTGLGLSNCVGILKGHGGFLHVYSQPRRGTTIAAYLPVIDQVASSSQSKTSSGLLGLRGNGECILVVDDEGPVRDIAREVLTSIGYTPITATDGTDALIQVAQNRDTIKVIITDLHMPFMDGESLINALKRMAPDIPVVAASGRIDEATADRLGRLKVSAILPKPFSQEQLSDVIARALRK